MTKLLGERITVAKLIEKLSKLSYDEITDENINNEFIGHNLQGLNVFDTMKDFLIDDYVFTIRRYSEDETMGSGFKVNDTVFLSSDVEVWLPCDNVGGNDIQATGTIKYENNEFYMKVIYYAD